ncbi:ent-kaur-16-ene synthase [Carex littledalei]|uniref:Ent-kaur-16-ene synthase n=1 Tax=Carex littledalei TaxID=544730 RepID=A0A833VXJ3_9POAL|nr:ent-kaur-16-ene synthase [Carex littledalei]
MENRELLKDNQCKDLLRGLYQDSIEKIKQQLKYVHMTASPYDTAWVAMVPHPSSHQDPCFDHCLDWILQNQHENGSWGNFNLGSSLLKDKLSSTLACVLALKKWSCGEEHIKNGVRFLVSNIGSIFDEQLTSPIGFNIIFPGMLKLATEVGLKLPLGDTAVGEIFSLQKLELQKNSINNSRGRKEYMAYIAEGLGSSQDLNEIMKFQRANGSVLNSPSTTAYVLTQCYDDKAFNYVSSLLQQVGSTVPAIYPMEMHSHLCMVDTLQNIGIARFFSDEIKIILDRAYRCWLERDEQIISDMATCAMAFRLLRMNGYDISSDLLMKFKEASSFHDSMQGYLRDLRPVIEIYKASQTKLFPNEDVLNKINSWSSILLKEEISTEPISHDRTISQEVKFALQFPFYANLDRLEHKRSIEQFNLGKIRMLKTSHMSCSANEDVLKLAIGDFNNCQFIYREELKDLNSWVKQCKLDQLQFARQKLTYCYLSGAATLFSPDLSEARISWSKNGVLTTIVDDFFDVGGSIEELESLVALFDKWDGKCDKEFYSKQVQIIYMAIHGNINELATKAFALQNQDITDHLVKIWLSLLRSMMTESKWQRNKSIPTVEEYMANGTVSFALGPIILPALYFVGPKITEEIIKHDEYDHLFRLVSTCGRLLNDIRGFGREGKEGKLNSVSLRILNSGNSLSIEAAEKDVSKSIEDIRTELLQLVLKEGTAVPKPCKELFWKMCKILHLFYMNTDGFSSPKEMVSAVNAVIHDSLNVCVGLE